jgi:SAM-dependent methyltransferase
MRWLSGLPPLTPRATLRWAALAPVVRQLRPQSILEIGCGQGALGARLAGHGRYLGIEPDARSFQRARERVTRQGGDVLHSSDDALGGAQRYDLVCAFEVLEHLADDTGAVRRWAARVRPGGHLLLSVPADPERFGPSDVLVGHYRRYDPAALGAVLATAGLGSCAIWRYGWPLGALLEHGRNAIARRRLDRPPGEQHAVGTPGSGRLLQPAALAGPAIRLAVAPFAYAQRFAPHRGTGLIALAHLPAQR